MGENKQGENKLGEITAIAAARPEGGEETWKTLVSGMFVVAECCQGLYTNTRVVVAQHSPRIGPLSETLARHSVIVGTWYQGHWAQDI